MKASILRWNRLERRAAALGVDLQTLIRFDAAAQRESLLEPDEEQSKIAPRQLRDGA